MLRAVWVLLLATSLLSAENAHGRTPVSVTSGRPHASSTAHWSWPVDPPHVVLRPFIAPPHRYGPGHRGVDVAADSGRVLAPADGSIAFNGTVAGRPLITIDHDGGYVTTLEPVESHLPPGARVSRGDAVGTVPAGGHTGPGTLHFGVRLDGEYINPMLLLGAVERAVLLPCC